MCEASVRFLDEGSHEAWKAAAHGAFGVFAAALAGYNVAAYCHRRSYQCQGRPKSKTHLVVNSAIYGGLIGLEAWKVVRHVQAGRER